MRTDRGRAISTRLVGLSALLAALTIAGGVEARRQTTAAPQTPATAESAALEKLRGSSMLDWRGEQQRIGYTGVHRLAPHNVVRRGPQASPLPESPRDFSTFTYSLKGSSYNLDHFMTRLNVVGLLIITDGKIVLERYAQGHAADTPWTS